MRIPRAAAALGAVAAALAAGAAFPLAGIGPGTSAPDRTATILVVSVPAGTPAPAGGRAPDGSRIVAVPLDGSGAPRVLTGGYAAAHDPCVSFDGSRFLFAGRVAEGDRDAIFEAAADGSGARRRAASPDGDCASPSYLPDGRVLFTAPAPGARGPGAGPGRAIFAAGGDEAAAARLTWFADGEEREPVVLADGRVLFVRERAGIAVLLAVHNDGTGIHPFHDPGPCAPGLRRPREASDRGVWFAGGGGAGSPGAFRVDARRPARAAATAPGIPGEVRAVEPLPDGVLLVSLRRGGGGASFGLRRFEEGGAPDGVPVLDDPGRDEVDPVSLAPRAAPKGHLSVVKEGVGSGDLFGIDARRTAGPRLADAAALRFLAVPREGGPALLLGEVPLERDGSFHARVPSDRPLRIEALDAAGRSLGPACGSAWVRPGEVRACLGCHEDPSTAPPNVLPASVEKEPADLAGAGAPGRGR